MTFSVVNLFCLQAMKAFVLCLLALRKGGVMSGFIANLKRYYWELERFIHVKKLQMASLNSSAQRKAAQEPSDIIVSLTSYPKRYPTLYLNIKSLLLQSYRPHLVMLWIAHDDYEALPQQIKELAKQNDLFTIRLCDDIRSFKKIIPALTEFPDFHIVTADDDVIYPNTWLQSLLDCWSGDSKEVVAHRAHKLLFTAEGALEPYDKWPAPKPGEKHEHVFQTGIGGVLYPKGSLHPAVTDRDRFMALCPTADDIWLYWMVREAGAKVKKSETGLNVVNLPGTDEHGLATQNVINQKNDEQMQRMFELYGKTNVS